jgi:hypothetical protein
VIAFGKQQFKDGAAMFLQAIRRGAYFHAFFNGRNAGGQKLVAAFDLNQAKPARTHIAQPVKVAQGGDVDLVLARNLENGLAGAAAHILAIDSECFTSTAALMLTPPREPECCTPAGQRLCTMCSMYSFLK